MMCGPLNWKFVFFADEFSRKQQLEAKAWPWAIGGSTAHVRTAWLLWQAKQRMTKIWSYLKSSNGYWNHFLLAGWKVEQGATCVTCRSALTPARFQMLYRNFGRRNSKSYLESLGEKRKKKWIWAAKVFMPLGHQFDVEFTAGLGGGGRFDSMNRLRVAAAVQAAAHRHNRFVVQELLLHQGSFMQKDPF